MTSKFLPDLTLPQIKTVNSGENFSIYSKILESGQKQEDSGGTLKHTLDKVNGIS